MSSKLSEVIYTAGWYRQRSKNMLEAKRLQHIKDKITIAIWSYMFIYKKQHSEKFICPSGTAAFIQFVIPSVCSTVLQMFLQVVMKDPSADTDQRGALP